MNLITEINKMSFDIQTGIQETILDILPTTIDEIFEVGVTIINPHDEAVGSIPYKSIGVLLSSNTIYYIDNHDRSKHLFDLYNQGVEDYEHEITYHQVEIANCYDKMKELKQYLRENL